MLNPSLLSSRFYDLHVAQLADDHDPHHLDRALEPVTHLRRLEGNPYRP